MALKVWLPLNGTLENKGISEQTAAITSTPNWVNSGKISGKALHTNTRQTTMYFPQLVGVKNYSVAYWLYIPSDETFTEYVDMFGIQFNCNTNTTWDRDERRASTSIGTHKYHLAKDTAAGSNTNPYWGIGPDRTDAKDVWGHFVMVKDDTSARFYANGVLVETVANSNFENTPRTMTGYMYLGDTNCAAYLNDFRIYDHCLSLKEIKEISQGLILHYKLDGWSGGAGENLLVNTSFKSQYTQSSGWDTSKNGTLLANSWGGYNSGVGNQATVYHAHLKDFNNEWVYEYHKTADETWLGISQGGLQTKLKAGEIYTFSWEEYHVEGANRVGTGLYYFKTDATSASFHLGIQQKADVSKTNIWQKCSYTFTAPTDADWAKNMSWYIYGHNNGNGIFYMRNPKLEKGSTATTWSPTPAEIGVDTTKITDSSGYEHDGTILGAPTTSSDAERYNVSMFFDGVDDGIQVESADLPAVLNNACTIAFWMKSTGENGGRSIYFSAYNASPFWCIEKSTANQFRYDWNGTPDQYNGTITDNVWTHICLCRDNTTSARLFINGKLNNTFTTATTSLALGNVWRIARDVRTGDGTPYHGLMNDFRIYATALSAEDVLDLYHTPASVDNLGGLHSFELKEDTNGRELLALPWTSDFNTHNKTSLWTNFNESGEWTSSVYSSSGSDYIKINPTGKTYYYDTEISVAAGNQFYIGFERYDASKTARSNQACVYVVAIKPSTDINHQRYFGTVNLATDGVNPTDTIALRILNAWTNTDSTSTKKATIHYLSLREVTGTPQTNKIFKNGQDFTDEFVQKDGIASIYQNGIVGANNFIEK